ncbi:Ras association domain-containing protein 8 [Schistosoma japonicum]|nr:Ras association domain-containing protein 8 [Schistosoma japonicum]
MDIKVNVDGVVRDVCGVHEGTTCEEVIFKLAQVSSLPGFYTLVVSYRDEEVTLSPEERIISFIKGTKENPSNICFILRRLESVSPFSPKNIKAYPPTIPSHQPTSRSHQQSRNPPRRSNVLATSENKDPYPSTSISTLPIPTHQYVVSSKQPKMYPGRESIHSPLILSSTSEDKTYHDVDQYNQLKDQLAYQEQQVELNRIRLLRLDKEINHLEQSARLGGGGSINNNTNKDGGGSGYCKSDLLSGSAVGPVAELAQLAATPWSQLLDTNRARQRELLSECERHKIAIDQVDNHLTKTKMNLSQLENQISQELNSLLNELEAYNQHRRLLLKSASSGSSQTRPRTNINSASDASNDGVAV